jgi:hypothetical protein
MEEDTTATDVQERRGFAGIYLGAGSVGIVALVAAVVYKVRSKDAQTQRLLA